MPLFKTKRWTPLDLACLKWSALLTGMVLGSYLHSFTRRYLVFFIAGIVLLAIRPLVAYFRRGNEQ